MNWQEQEAMLGRQAWPELADPQAKAIEISDEQVLRLALLAHFRVSLPTFYADLDRRIAALKAHPLWRTTRHD